GQSGAGSPPEPLPIPPVSAADSCDARHPSDPPPRTTAIRRPSSTLRRRMADVQPLEALHYDQAKAGSLQQLVAPPYDVIDAEQRAELAARSPYNVLRVDLPEGDDPYAEAARLFQQWQDEDAVIPDEPAFWALVQDYTGPD